MYDIATLRCALTEKTWKTQGIYLPKPTPIQCLARFRASAPVSVIMVRSLPTNRR